MLSIKALKPSQREKKRYVVYEISGMESENMFSIQNKLVTRLNEMLGIYDSATAGIQPLKYNQEIRRGLIRVNNKMVDKIKGCFPLITKLDKEEISLKSVGVSGSMKKAKEKYLELKESNSQKNNNNK